MGNTVLEAASDLVVKQTELIGMSNHEANEGKVFVLVEGPDDEIIYRTFIDKEKVKFYQTKNCLYIVELLRSLKNNSSFANRLIGIKDADFDHILNRSYPDLDNLFLTDNHDIEMTMLSHPKNFEDLLKSEYDLPAQTELVEKIMEDLKSLSYLRLYNEVEVSAKKSVGIKLDGINFEAITFCDLYTGSDPVDMVRCLAYVKSKCNNARLTHFPTERMMNTFIVEYNNPDLKQLTRGHDFVYALQVRLKSLAGKDPWGYKALCLMLRTKFTQEEFKTTSLYHDLAAWMTSRGLNLWKVA